MRVSIKTGGLLGKHLPPGSDGNRADIEVPDGATPLEVIAQLGMPEDWTYLVIHNGAAVPKAERGTLRDHNRFPVAMSTPKIPSSVSVTSESPARPASSR